MTTTVVDLHVSSLRTRGIQNFEEWFNLPDSVYIGRDMSRFPSIGPKAKGSKWQNNNKLPKNATDKNREECLIKYERDIRNNPKLMSELPELRGKELGCWCHPKPCHGHILLKLLDELE